MGSAFADFLAFISLDENKNKFGKDEFILRLARHLTMNPEGLAARYLENFLSGTGNQMTFSTEKLLKDDAGVAERIIGEVSRRALGTKTVRESAQDSRMCLTSSAKADRRIITIFQKNYKVRDWQLALGSFSFDWEVIADSDKEMRVRIWGEDIYTWHPNSLRITQFLHQAGYRLSQTGKAKDFKIVAQPTTVIVSKKYADLLKLSASTQVNPSHGKFPIR